MLPTVQSLGTVLSSHKGNYREGGSMEQHHVVINKKNNVLNTPYIMKLFTTFEIGLVEDLNLQHSMFQYKIYVKGFK
jgi:hypothetical protein